MVPRFGKRLKGKRRRKAAPDAEGSPSHLLSHHLCGGRWCVSTKGGAGPLGPRSGLGSEGSEGKVDGAFGPEGCIEGLCSQRGNDSLHFACRFAPSSTAVTDSLDFQVADAPLQIQFASAKCVRCASTGKRLTRFSGRCRSPTARLSPTHNILRVTAFLHPLLSLTHWIFGSLMLPYKSSSHSASTAVTDSLDFRVADAPLQIQFA